MRWWWVSFACLWLALALCAYTFGANNHSGAAPVPLIVLLVWLFRRTHREAVIADPVAADKLDAVVAFRNSRYDPRW